MTQEYIFLATKKKMRVIERKLTLVKSETMSNYFNISQIREESSDDFESSSSDSDPED